MAARAGMAELLTRWRRLVQDTAAATWDDDEAQALLDDHRQDCWMVPLSPVVVQAGPNLTVYQRYRLPWGNVEGTASGTAVWRVYDSTGATIASGYTLDQQVGHVVFAADQAGSARYVDARRYDLYGAAADALEQQANAVAGSYDFRTDEQEFKRSQAGNSYRETIERLRARSWTATADIYRSDDVPGWQER